jgi:hypothetical protein
MAEDWIEMLERLAAAERIAMPQPFARGVEPRAPYQPKPKPAEESAAPPPIDWDDPRYARSMHKPPPPPPKGAAYEALLRERQRWKEKHPSPWKTPAEPKPEQKPLLPEQKPEPEQKPLLPETPRPKRPGIDPPPYPASPIPPSIFDRPPRRGLYFKPPTHTQRPQLMAPPERLLLAAPLERRLLPPPPPRLLLPPPPERLLLPAGTGSAAPRRSRGRPRGGSKASRIEAALRERPYETNANLARQLGVSERSVQLARRRFLEAKITPLPARERPYSEAEAACLLTPARRALHTRARIRYTQWQHVLVHEFSDYRACGERVTLGNFAHAYSRSRRREIKSEFAIELEPGLQLTPMDIALDYLDVAYPRRLRATKQQREAITAPRPAPLYALPGRIRCGHYVDLSGAYWQIMQIIGWDVDYFPGSGLTPGRPPHDFPFPEHKLARNCLVTAGLSRPLSIWTGQREIETHPDNRHLNYGLWAALMDILHLVAQQAVACGARYVATDGYILPDEGLPRFADWLDSFPLKWKIKASGEAEIDGVHSYRVGTKRSRQRLRQPHPFCNLYAPPAHLEDELLIYASQRVACPDLFLYY